MGVAVLLKGVSDDALAALAAVRRCLRLTPMHKGASSLCSNARACGRFMGDGINVLGAFAVRAADIAPVDGAVDTVKRRYYLVGKEPDGAGRRRH